NLSAGKFPPRAAPGLLPVIPDEDELAAEAVNAEEARLFFVALTRARDHLVLSRALRYGRFSAKSSPLLACLDGAPEVRQEVWKALTSVTPAPSPSPSPADGRGVPGMAVAAANGGSVTAGEPHHRLPSPAAGEGL